MNRQEAAAAAENTLGKLGTGWTTHLFLEGEYYDDYGNRYYTRLDGDPEAGWDYYMTHAATGVLVEPQGRSSQLFKASMTTPWRTRISSTADDPADAVQVLWELLEANASGIRTALDDLHNNFRGALKP